MDLSEFLAPFFEECFEMLQQMEGDLLALDGGDNAGVSDRIDSIFRVAHSIKGGAGTFGFSRITEYTHSLEALLDAVREGQREMTPDAVRVMLESVDVLRDMLAAERDGGSPDQAAVERTLGQIRALLNGEKASVAERAPTPAPAPAVEEAVASVMLDEPPSQPEALPAEPMATPASIDGQGWRIRFRPHEDIASQGSDPLRILRELAALGAMRSRVIEGSLPPVHSINPRHLYLAWDITLEGEVSREQVEDVFAWVMDQAEISIEPLGDVVMEGAPAFEQSEDEHQAHEGDVQVDEPEPAELDLAGLASVMTDGSEPEQVAGKLVDPVPGESRLAGQQEAQPKPQAGGSLKDVAPAAPPAVAKPAAQAAPASAAVPKDGGSIRVGIDKVDAIIDLVGELVITQSMLGQFSEEVERDGFVVSMLQRLKDGLTQLERNTRELQENVMRIRMLPISVAFNRFPRMVHDISRQLGKQIELKISGENTELDKTVLEKIGDPLVHLVRNALDHGLEPVEERLAAGKPATGTLSLNAYHKGGNIIIEIGEDGRGINKAKVLAKAREKGLVGPDEQLSDDRIHELIFAPGFSTADQVTDISGRGVGMDVVKRNIHTLGGGLEVRSEEGKGTTFVIRLPLTLSIMDGQLVVVGEHTYILPLMSIVESLQIAPERLSRVAGRAEVYKLREDYIPVVRLNEIFRIDARDNNERPLLVVIEGEGHKVGLMIDDLLGQQQVVIKSLETNFRRVDGLSGSTILGDGTVALILDVGGLFQMGRSLERKKGVAA